MVAVTFHTRPQGGGGRNGGEGGCDGGSDCATAPQAKQRLLACGLREEMIMRSIQGGWHADKYACVLLHGGGHRSLPRPELARAVVLARADPAGASVAGGEG